MQNARKAGHGEKATLCVEAVLENGQRLERGEGFLVRHERCKSPEEALGATKSRKMSLSVRHAYGSTLAEP